MLSNTEEQRLVDNVPTPRQVQGIRTLREPFVTSSDVLLPLYGTGEFATLNWPLSRV
jgi:hypothetical protein